MFDAFLFTPFYVIEYIDFKRVSIKNRQQKQQQHTIR